MLKNSLGYPRIGAQRELKKACEKFWAGTITLDELQKVGQDIRLENWKVQLDAGIDLIPCNDFSFYDHILDMSLTLGVIPQRYHEIAGRKDLTETDLYFAMARGYQRADVDVTAMEMTKWFDTNYHYIVPEFTASQTFSFFSKKIVTEFREAKEVLGSKAKPVIPGPVSFLLLGKEKEGGFDKIELIQNLVPVYVEILNELKSLGAEWIQIDEPFLALDLNEKEKEAFLFAYNSLHNSCEGIKILLTTYFEGLKDNTEWVLSLPVCAIHLDLVRDPKQLDLILDAIPDKLSLSLGVVDGRNIWKNRYKDSLECIEKAENKIGSDRVMIASSCSLLHTPYDLDFEVKLDAEIKDWLAFSRQKIYEISDLYHIQNGQIELLPENENSHKRRQNSALIHNPSVKRRVAEIAEKDKHRASEFGVRQEIQKMRFNLPLFPTTTIGSFPQTQEIRQLRSKFKKGELTIEEYENELKTATKEAVLLQEKIGIDVFVHGEFERNDMVEYFGEQLEGFVFTQNGWVQSYGSRCVKPPVIFGDVSRPYDMTVKWSSFAQSCTQKPVKGMLTGPVTILQWSFVRDDQPGKDTAYQIALAIRDEVSALEKAGISIIQIDEPAFREGLPLRKEDMPGYLAWAVEAFRLSSSEVKDETQIHTHMCYSEFNDIIEHIALMDADVITLETSRSQMELLEAFSDFKYPNEIGPGVYDIHSPRVASSDEMYSLLRKACNNLPLENIWVNPDCGLKTRKWPETEASLKNMIKAAQMMRELVQEKVK